MTEPLDALPLDALFETAGDSSGALAGLVVADFSRVLAAPLAAATLADLGATVIKVENPLTGGDDTRHWGPPFAHGRATYFAAANRNKLSLALDLRDEDDLALARELALRADVLLENFRPGVAERLGLGYEELAAENPGLIWGALTGFGSQGVGAEMGGYDFLVQAASGLMSITGPAEGEPAKVGVAVVDVLAGLNLQVGVLAALAARQRTGRGQRVEVTLMGSALAALVNQASGYLEAGVVPGRRGNEHPSICPYETFPTAAGELVLAVGNDAQFAKLATVLGQPELATDPRFARNADRVAHRAELSTVLVASFASRPAEEWVELITAAKVPAGTVNSVAQGFDLATDVGLPAIVEIEDPAGDPTPHRQVASPLQLSDTPVSYRLPPPDLDRAGDAIRDWLREAR